jgi:uncharacterized membrane protein
MGLNFDKFRLDKYTDKALAITGSIAFLVAVFMILPTSISIYVTIFFAVAFAAIVYAQSRWVEAMAD